MKGLTTKLVITLITSTSFVLVGCAERWPIKNTVISALAVKQSNDSDSAFLDIYIPDAGMNSAIWPIAILDEIGNDVIVIKIKRGGAVFPLGSPSGDKIKVKREPGKRYTIIVRDENDMLNYVKDYYIK